MVFLHKFSSRTALIIGSAQFESTMPRKNKYIGSNFDDFLAECGILEEVTAVAKKRVVAWQIEQATKTQPLPKAELAAKPGASLGALS